MTDKHKFGQFISEKRIQRSMNKQELAQALGISTAYLSQLESGVRSNPTADVLNRIITLLNLSLEDKYHLYDLYAKANDVISPDITEYIKQNIIVVWAIRAARERNATDQDWQNFIDRLKK